MIKILKAADNAWQIKPKHENDVTHWVIAHKTDNQNQKQCLLVEIIPFSASDNDLSLNRILH